MATCTQIVQGEAGISSVVIGRRYRWFWQVTVGISSWPVQYTIYNADGSVFLRWDSDNPTIGGSIVSILEVGVQPLPDGTGGEPANGTVTLDDDDSATLLPGRTYVWALELLTADGPVWLGDGQLYAEMPVYQ